MNARPIIIILTALSIFFACERTTSDHSQTLINNQIELVLKQQKESWNSGSIEGFMHHYWKSDAFTFQSGDRRLRGWSELLAMYQQNYSGENMGTLDFSDIEIHVLSNNVAYALGRWRVTKQDTSRQGLFTLIFKKMNDRWRIIVDHSS